MSENEETRSIRAGEAFMAAVHADPKAQQVLADALKQLGTFAKGVEAVRVSEQEIIRELQHVLAEIERITNNIAEDQRRLIQEGYSEFRAERERLFAELGREAERSLESASQNLASFGFEPPGNDLDAWLELARIVEKEPGPMTLQEINLWATAWAKRELLRREMDLNFVRNSEAHGGGRPASVRSADDASIRRDEHNPTIAYCVGKRIYLGEDTQISRLFWLLASPVGRARTLGEVQRAVDDMETTRQMDESGDAYKKASQRVRKAISKLRAAFCEAKVDDHLLIVRGGNRKDPEYTMVLRAN